MGVVVIPKLELFNKYLNLFGKKARHKEILIKHKAFHLFRFEAPLHCSVQCSSTPFDKPWNRALLFANKRQYASQKLCVIFDVINCRYFEFKQYLDCS